MVYFTKLTRLVIAALLFTYHSAVLSVSPAVLSWQYHAALGADSVDGEQPGLTRGRFTVKHQDKSWDNKIAFDHVKGGRFSEPELITLTSRIRFNGFAVTVGKQKVPSHFLRMTSIKNRLFTNNTKLLKQFSDGRATGITVSSAVKNGFGFTMGKYRNDGANIDTVRVNYQQRVAAAQTHFGSNYVRHGNATKQSHEVGLFFDHWHVIKHWFVATSDRGEVNNHEMFANSKGALRDTAKISRSRASYLEMGRFITPHSLTYTANGYQRPQLNATAIALQLVGRYQWQDNSRVENLTPNAPAPIHYSIGINGYFGKRFIAMLTTNVFRQNSMTASNGKDTERGVQFTLHWLF